MPGWRRRLFEIVHRRRVDRDLAEELAGHVERLVARYREAGLSEDQARRRARLEAGSVEAARQRVAEERSGFVLEQMLREARHAARVLGRSPGLTALCAVTMAVGIGVSTVLFALVDAVVLRPLPYPEAARLVRIVDTNAPAGINRAGAAGGNLHDWRQRASAFAGIAGYYAMGRTLSTDRESEVVISAQVTADFFRVAGVSPVVGRGFTDDEVAALARPARTLSMVPAKEPT